MKKIKKNNKGSVCIVGLGFVGLTLATVMANRGFIVYGVEKNKSILDHLKNKKSHFFEPGLEKNLQKIIKNKKFSYFDKVPKKKDITTYIITVGTPLSDKKKILINYIIKAIKDVSKVVKNNDIVILRSTVKIGTTKNIVYPILKKTKKNFKLAFCPERAVEGSALKELYFLPQIIGAIDQNSENEAVKIFKNITKKIIITSNIETAEMIKLIDNSSRDVFFAYANEIMLLCEKLGVDTHECIKNSNIHYGRNNIPLPSPGVGGPCLSKDPYLLIGKDDILELHPEQKSLILAGRKINESIPKTIADKIKRLMYA